MTLPHSLSKYKPVRLLGQGAMGIVYEATDPDIHRRVAIKVLRQAVSDDDPMIAKETLNRFRREAQAAGRLNHPNIVTIFEFVEEDGVALIIMELVEGQELRQVMSEGMRVSVVRAVEIVDQILAGVEYSHRLGVIHRDIKPANIMVGSDGWIKITDFGIARFRNTEDATGFTAPGSVLGTPSYMSPEQFLGQSVDHRTDIFSIGVLLYELLAGERPFVGSYASIMHKVTTGNAVDCQALNPLVSVELNAILKKAMARLPGERYQSAQQLRSELKGLNASEPPPAEAAVAPRTPTSVSSRSTAIYASSFVLLLVLAAVSFNWIERQLATNSTSPGIAKINRAAIQVRSWRFEPIGKGMGKLTAALENTGAAPIALPTLRVSLKDSSGKIIQVSEVTPLDYASNDPTASSSLGPSSERTVVANLHLSLGVVGASALEPIRP